MQTDTSKASNWGSAEHLPIIPFCAFLTVYFFQGPRNWEWCFFFFLNFYPQDGFGRCFCSSTKHVLLFPEMEISHITAANSTQYRKQVLFVFGNRFESWPFPVGVTPISCGFVPAAATVCVWNLTTEHDWVCFISVLPAQTQTENVAVMFWVRFVSQSLPWPGGDKGLSLVLPWLMSLTLKSSSNCRWFCSKPHSHSLPSPFL